MKIAAVERVDDAVDSLALEGERVALVRVERGRGPAVHVLVLALEHGPPVVDAEDLVDVEGAFGHGLGLASQADARVVVADGRDVDQVGRRPRSHVPHIPFECEEVAAQAGEGGNRNRARQSARARREA